MSNEQDENDADGRSRFDSNEPTVVAVPRDFLIGSLGRTSGALYRAGDVALEARRLVTAGAGKAALRDLKEELIELRQILDGAVRALERVEISDP